MGFKVVDIVDYQGFSLGPGELNKTHTPSQCASDDQCVIHNPSDHHMLTWPAVWRADKQLVERKCKHGVGHPDPDALAFLIEHGKGYVGTHGCDGCCTPPDPSEELDFS